VSPHGALAEVVPAAPAAVGLALAVAGLLAFTAFLIATGMGKLYAETLGAFIRWLASRIDVNLHIPHFGGHPFRSLSHGLYAADTQIRNAFAAAALRFESAASWCFTTAGNTIVWMARETADLAHEVWGAVQHTTVAAIPNAIRRAEAVTLPRLRGIDHAVGRIEAQARAQLARLRVGIDRLGHRLEAKIGTAVRGVGARVGRLERTVKADAKTIGRLQAKWRAVAFAAAVGVALERLGLRWLRCPALGRAGRKIGCKGFGLLDELLAVSFVPLLLTDACAFVRQLERLAVAIQPALAEFVLGVEGWVCGGPQSLPSGIVAGDLKRVAKLPSGL
jgi:hypothetical protein